MIPWLLLGCPYIPEDVHQERVAGLPGEIDPVVDDVQGGLLLRCVGAGELVVHGTVAPRWAELDLLVHVAVDDQPFLAAGTVHTGPVAGDRAAFEFTVPARDLDVPPCESGLCEHDLRVSLALDVYEDDTVVVGAVRRPGGRPTVVEAFVGGSAGAATLSEVERLTNPSDAVPIGDWWTLGAAFADPWVAAGGDPYRYVIHLEQCPRFTSSGSGACISSFAALSTVHYGGDFGVEASAYDFADATCTNPVMQPGDLYVVVVDTECDSMETIALGPDDPLRFVTPDCDNDEMTVGQGDCDDTDPDVHPGARDPAADGLDWDCDGLD